MYKIEKGVLQAGGAACKFPLQDMEISDSFFVPENEIGRNLRSYIYAWGKKINMKFSVKTMPDGIRVWRVEPKK